MNAPWGSLYVFISFFFFVFLFSSWLIIIIFLSCTSKTTTKIHTIILHKVISHNSSRCAILAHDRDGWAVALLLFNSLSRPFFGAIALCSDSLLPMMIAHLNIHNFCLSHVLILLSSLLFLPSFFSLIVSLKFHGISSWLLFCLIFCVILLQLWEIMYTRWL